MVSFARVGVSIVKVIFISTAAPMAELDILMLGFWTELGVMPDILLLVEESMGFPFNIWVTV